MSARARAEQFAVSLVPRSQCRAADPRSPRFIVFLERGRTLPLPPENGEPRPARGDLPPALAERKRADRPVRARTPLLPQAEGQIAHCRCVLKQKRQPGKGLAVFFLSLWAMDSRGLRDHPRGARPLTTRSRPDQSCATWMSSRPALVNSSATAAPWVSPISTATTPPGRTRGAHRLAMAR